MKNECAKTIKGDRETRRRNAYEVWTTNGWTWYVLKKYQSPDNEAKNPYARWFCDVTSPFVGEAGEMGDVYVREIINYAVKVR